ncbi:NB-ARC domains-containing protein [Tanacetum coccineum]
MIKVAASIFRVKETEESWHDRLMNLIKWPEKGMILCKKYIGLLIRQLAVEELLDAGVGVEVIFANGREVLDYLKMVSLVEENKFLQLDVEFWKEKKWISLVDSKMNALHNHPDCSTLSTLILQKNKNSEVIPRAFFKHMPSLRVLDLYDTRITSLPNSLLKLATLKVLYLQKCVALVEIYREIGNLQKLKVLDIRGSGLENIPPQVESLISLRQLVVDVEDGLERILYGAIVNVVKLTRLSLL